MGRHHRLRVRTLLRPKSNITNFFSRLTVHGMNQAHSLGETLKKEPVTHVVSSDLRRAHRTAEAVAKHHGHVQLVTSDLLRERDFGELEGKPWRLQWTAKEAHLMDSQELKDAHKVIDDTIEKEKGESTDAMKARAVAAWEYILSHVNEHQPAHHHFTNGTVDIEERRGHAYVVVVSHGLFLAALFSVICDYYQATRPHVFWGNTSYTKFTVHPERDPVFQIHELNETGHLKSVQRQKGGIGSSQFDEKQKSIKEYF